MGRMNGLLSVLFAMLTAFHSSQASPAVLKNVVTIGEQGIQLAAQAGQVVPFDVPKNNSIYPNIKDLAQAAYRDANGHWVPVGSSVMLLGEYTSFGDLNKDGIDDAVVVIKKTSPLGQSYFLAAMLNQGGVMFDVAERPLGSTIAITTHKISAGEIDIDSARYILFGIEIQQL